MIEAAVVLPVLLLLLLGIMEVCRVLMTYNLLTRAVRTGARLAVVTPDLRDGDPRILDRISGLVEDGGAAVAESEVTFIGDNKPKEGEPLRGKMLLVRAQVEFVPAVSMVFKRIEFPLRAQVIARHE